MSSTNRPHPAEHPAPVDRRVFGLRPPGMPLLSKLLVANVAIVMAGAVAGTYVTASTLAHTDRLALAFFFAAIGIVASGLVNYVVLRAAFQPLSSLEDLADHVRRGDLSARAQVTAAGDPSLVRLVDTFNTTLDTLQRDQDQLRQLATRVIEAQEAERKRIARELHDDTAQVLFAQLLRATALKTSPYAEVRATAEQLESLTVEAIESVRRLALELRPPALDDLGLKEALEALVQRFCDANRIEANLDLSGFHSRLPPEVELVLYRVAQEALTNIGKHAAAANVSVVLRQWRDWIDLTIDDDGIGLDPRRIAARDEEGLGLGLFGMQERVTLVGGVLAIRSLAPHGTRVAASIPIAPQATATADQARRDDS